MVEGFEEAELVMPVDLLRRAGVEVVIAALGDLAVPGKQGMRLEADVLLADADPKTFDLLMLPGGPGVATLLSDGRAAELAKQFADAGKVVAAICAAPLVLADAGLLEGKRFTAYPSVRADLGEGCVDERVVVDGDLITSRGPGTAIDFGLAMITALLGEETASRIAEEIAA